jgi:hypothetical protein
VGLEQIVATGRAIVRIATAGVLAGVAALFVWVGLDEWLGRSLGGQLVSLAAALAVATATYVGSARVLGVRELDALLLLRARRPESSDER